MSSPYRYWTGEELAVLRRDYSRLGPTKVAAALPGRTASQVTAVAFRLGLRRTRRWTVRMIGIIRTHYPRGGSAACIPLLDGVPVERIHKTAARYGIRYLGEAA